MITIIPFRVDVHGAVTREFRLVDNVLMHYYDMTMGIAGRETAIMMVSMGGAKRISRDDMRELLDD